MMIPNKNKDGVDFQRFFFLEMSLLPSTLHINCYMLCIITVYCARALTGLY